MGRFYEYDGYGSSTPSIFALLVLFAMVCASNYLFVFKYRQRVERKKNHIKPDQMDSIIEEWIPYLFIHLIIAGLASVPYLYVIKLTMGSISEDSIIGTIFLCLSVYIFLDRT